MRLGNSHIGSVARGRQNFQRWQQLQQSEVSTGPGTDSGLWWEQAYLLSCIMQLLFQRDEGQCLGFDPSHKVIFSEMLKTMKADFHGMCGWCYSVYRVLRKFEMSERQVTHYPVTSTRISHSPGSPDSINSIRVCYSQRVIDYGRNLLCNVWKLHLSIKGC